MLKFSIHYMKKEDQSCNCCKKVIRPDNLFIVEFFDDKQKKISFNQNEKIYHSHCFARIRSHLKWNQSADKLIGFYKLSNSTQERLKNLFT